ncbi:MAG: glutathione S-transferase family protein [Alphaproteobacteria bacterium]
MADIEIVSTKTCPYAQRSRMALVEKGVDFDYKAVDLSNKPDWFLRLSPYGKVPVVRRGDEVVFESAIINEYLDEIFPQPALLPRDPYLRAWARIWIDFANTRFTAAYGAVIYHPDADKAAVDTLMAHVHTMESNGLARFADGPYWLGRDVSLVDITYWPWFERWTALAEARGIAIPADCVHTLKWVDVMRQRESARQTANPPESFVESWRARLAPRQAAE